MEPETSYFANAPHSAKLGQHAMYPSKANSSGTDGYEAFENTNNKKKRKIPTSGSLSLSHSNLASDFAHMGISGHRDGSLDGSHYTISHSGAAPGLGVQGAGRGRNTRKLPGRNPLGVSVNGSNARSGPSKYDQNMSTTAKGRRPPPPAPRLGLTDEKAEESKDQGIISAAIANATALLRKPLNKGQENVGVLDQQVKSAPTNSQFTFTCETEAKGVTFPEQSLYSPGYSQRNNLAPSNQSTPAQKVSNHGTQTTSHAPTSGAPHAPVAAGTNANANANAQGKKPRRRRGDVYALAARERKLQTKYNNLQHPPAPEDIWICEFCEYESIFGEPPHALIRQYEIKDRKERRRLAEKRRLLEKAKLKGRKGKKQSKNAAKAANQAALPVHHSDYHTQGLDPLGDDELDYGYDDDPIPMPAPPAATGASSNPPATSATANVDANLLDKAGGGTGGGGGGGR
jgi:hypothetical protein